MSDSMIGAVAGAKAGAMASIAVPSTLAGWLSYEHFVCEHHSLTTGHDVFHWSAVGDELLLASGFVDGLNQARAARIERDRTTRSRREYGLDGIARDQNGVHHGIQAKLWRTRKLTAADLATFVNVVAFRMSRKEASARGFLYTTTTLQQDLQDDFIRSGLFHYRHLPFTASSAPPPPLQLRPYQQQALEALAAGWSGFGALIMPCGTGKTITFANHARRYRRVIIISPLRVSARQNLDRVGDVLGRAWPSLLVDADAGGATRDVNEVRRVWAEDRALVSSTYKSAMDVLRAAIFCAPLDKTTLVVVDEAHNASADLLAMLAGCARVLLCTATPTAALSDDAGGAGGDGDGDGDGDGSDGSDGDGAQRLWRDSVATLFRYSFADAIGDKYICDYEIRLPLIEGERGDEMGMQARFVLDGLLRTGARRIIVFCSSREECDAFTGTVRRVAFEFHGLAADELWTGTITCDVSSRRREELLRQFQYGDPAVTYVLAAVRILDEAVDIPRCDSVCILHPSQDAGSWRRMIQRLCRAVRLDPQNAQKVARAFLWLPDGDVPRCLRVLRDCDPEFLNKLRLQSFAAYDVGGEAASALRREAEATAAAQQEYRVHCLTSEEIKAAKIGRVVEFIRNNGKRPSRGCIAEDGSRIGIFTDGLRHGNVLLSADQRHRLVAADAGFFDVRPCSNAAKNLSKDAKIKCVIDYIGQTGKRPPQGWIAKDGFRLGMFVNNLRQGAVKVSVEQRQRLETADPAIFCLAPAPTKATVDAKVNRVAEYLQEHGTKPPKRHVTASGLKLGKFADNLRSGHTQISEAQRQRLTSACPSFFAIQRRTATKTAATGSGATAGRPSSEAACGAEQPQADVLKRQLQGVADSPSKRARQQNGEDDVVLSPPAI
ncbi:P-loop containing nucleoside triphosphate hydrolase protein [Tribonema minus]|uniref:P-loop containing nucleoside triphosphate hydrolase protein n=1 Tax=Tribonema minus TaxID=303371 RepID=A0A836CGQ5_9STRA|nr:P-loop containing nucleoside triphosphate hydrolase protein [Tribonema minus]